MSKLTDEMLREALMRLQDIEMSEMPDEDELDIEFSPRFEKKMRKLIRKTDHKVQYYLQRVACIALVALLGFSALSMLMKTDAWAQFTGWVHEQFGHFEHYFYDGPTSETLLDDVAYRPTWLPEGYEEDSVVEIETGIMVTYKNEAGKLIRFRCNSLEVAREMYVDAVDINHEVLIVDNQILNIQVSTNETIASSIVWENDKSTAFYVSGFISKEDLVKIAMSVE